MALAEVIYESAIICDEVRQEIGGKMFLIGVFAADLLFNAFPQDVNFAIYAEGTVKKGGSFLQH